MAPHNMSEPPGGRVLTEIVVIVCAGRLVVGRVPPSEWCSKDPDGVVAPGDVRRVRQAVAARGA